jgi:polysaccharide export outer membrane protein
VSQYINAKHKKEQRSLSLVPSLCPLVVKKHTIKKNQLNNSQNIPFVLFISTHLKTFLILLNYTIFAVKFDFMKKVVVLQMLGILLLLSSCAAKKDILYLNGLKANDTANFQWSDVIIQPNDILSVKITAEDMELAMPYNLISGNGQQQNIQGTQLLLQGYLVSNEGKINIPVLGEVEVKDMTYTQVEEKIQNELTTKQLLKKPVVVCRIVNAKVTILGEVRSPGTYTFYENNLTILQALGLAGDLNITGVRKNIKVIRLENNKQLVGEIDLTQKNWMNSPFYFIKPNDVIVVDPNTAKVKSAGIIGNAGTLLGAISVILSSFLIIRSL